MFIHFLLLNFSRNLWDLPCSYSFRNFFPIHKAVWVDITTSPLGSSFLRPIFFLPASTIKLFEVNTSNQKACNFKYLSTSSSCAFPFWILAQLFWQTADKDIIVLLSTWCQTLSKYSDWLSPETTSHKKSPIDGAQA